MSAMSAADWVTVLSALGVFVTIAGGVAVKIFSVRLEYEREERRAELEIAREERRAELERVARAAAVGRPAVVEVIDELERSGVFPRPTFPPEEGG